MHANSERIRKKWADGEVVWGTQTSFGGAVTGEILGEAGFDALWIDTEHGCIDKKEVLETVIGASASGMATFIRVPWNDPVLVKPILEMGVDGIVFPFVLNAEEAKRAVASCRYPPDGVRGFGPTRANRYGKIGSQDYIHNYSERILKVIQIEHIEAVRNLDAILEVDGIDAIIIGCCDLSGSIGILAQVEHDEISKLCDEIAVKVKATGIPFGTSTGYNPPFLRHWLDRGANFIFAENDFNYLYRGAREVYEGMKSLEK
jgi:2-dehydro-3-deoxyglucarate aldolase/4-hydroxy-2-oxoheptanedioate aldolase